jgi:hypothetical protein
MAKTQPTDSLPKDLEGARERFEKWRETRKQGERIPGRLWDLAVKSAGRHGPYKTARALRLDYVSLKRRLTQRAEAAATKSETPRFVEVTGIAALKAPECVAWVEGPAGARLRLEIRGLDGAEIGAMARSFAGGGQ